MAVRNYSRKYYRIKPDGGLYAQMSLAAVGKRRIKTGGAKVKIENISPGGLSFSTALKFPVRPDVILEFLICTSGKDIKLQGHIVHKAKVTNDSYKYGICFTNIDDAIRSYLMSIFNNMAVRMHKHVVILKFN